jgi:hypothetical protein
MVYLLMSAYDGEKLADEQIIGLWRTMAFEDAGKHIIEDVLDD